MRVSLSLHFAAAVLAAGFGSAANAADQVAASALVSAPVSATAPAASASNGGALPTPARHSPFASKPVTAAVLGARRGGDRVFNDAQLKGVVSDNQAVNVSTGMNVISDGAFSGSSGLSTVIQNSGNNVLIQNATIVNVQLK